MRNSIIIYFSHHFKILCIAVKIERPTTSFPVENLNAKFPDVSSFQKYKCLCLYSVFSAVFFPPQITDKGKVNTGGF